MVHQFNVQSRYTQQPWQTLPSTCSLDVDHQDDVVICLGKSNLDSNIENLGPCYAMDWKGNSLSMELWTLPAMSNLGRPIAEAATLSEYWMALLQHIQRAWFKYGGEHICGTKQTRNLGGVWSSGERRFWVSDAST